MILQPHEVCEDGDFYDQLKSSSLSSETGYLEDCIKLSELRTRAINDPLLLEEYYATLGPVAKRLENRTNVKFVWKKSLGNSNAPIEGTSFWFERCNVAFNIGVYYFNCAEELSASHKVDPNTREGRALARRMAKSEGDITKAVELFLKAASAFKTVRTRDSPLIPSQPPLELNDATMMFLEDFCIANALNVKFSHSHQASDARAAAQAYDRAKASATKCSCLRSEIETEVESMAAEYASFKKKKAAALPTVEVAELAETSGSDLFAMVLPVNLEEKLAKAETLARNQLMHDVIEVLLQESTKLKSRLVQLELPVSLEVIAQPTEIPLSLRMLSTMINEDPSSLEALKQLRARSKANTPTGDDSPEPEASSVEGQLLSVYHMTEILASRQRIGEFLPKAKRPLADTALKSKTASARQFGHQVLGYCWAWDRHAKKIEQFKSLANVTKSLRSYPLEDLEKLDLNQKYQDVVKAEIEYASKQLLIAQELTKKLDAYVVDQVPEPERVRAGMALFYVGIQFLQLKDTYLASAPVIST